MNARLGSVFWNDTGRQRVLQIYNAGSRVSTCGISFQKNMYIPGRVLEIMEEYGYVKFIHKFAFQCIHAEWFGSLSALQAMRLLVTES